MSHLDARHLLRQEGVEDPYSLLSLRQARQPPSPVDVRVHLQISSSLPRSFSTSSFSSWVPANRCVSASSKSGSAFFKLIASVSVAWMTFLFHCTANADQPSSSACSDRFQMLRTASCCLQPLRGPLLQSSREAGHLQEASCLLPSCS